MTAELICATCVIPGICIPCTCIPCTCIPCTCIPCTCNDLKFRISLQLSVIAGVAGFNRYGTKGHCCRQVCSIGITGSRTAIVFHCHCPAVARLTCRCSDSVAIIRASSQGVCPEPTPVTQMGAYAAWSSPASQILPHPCRNTGWKIILEPEFGCMKGWEISSAPSLPAQQARHNTLHGR